MERLAARLPPNEADIRVELDNLLGFEPLRKSPQLVSFLRYVIEATLSHATAKLKGYTIAIDALGRDSNFDPQRDPIVRVEAVRLRRILAMYYEGPGARDNLKITMPPGGYVPVFQWTELPIGTVASPPIVPDVTVSPSAPRTMTYVGVALAALAGAALVGQFGRPAFERLMTGLLGPT